MSIRIQGLASALVVVFATNAFAAQPPPGLPPFDRAAMEREQAAYNLLPDSSGTGLYPAIKEEIPALPDHVVYRPKDLSKLGSRKLGVLAWGNGGCAKDGAGSRLHLLEIASHGYLAIANGTILSGPGSPPAAPAAPFPTDGSLPPPQTQATGLTQAIDWALKENQRAGSPFFGRIDPAMVAVSGWSCGGVQALRVAPDPRIKAVIIHNSGLFEAGANRMPGMDLGKEALKLLHTPVIYIEGGPTDIAYANGMDDFKRIEHVPAAIANLDVGHGGTFMRPNGGAAATVAVSWLEWQLRGDKSAAARFVGPDCGLCRDSAWKLERKNFPATIAQN
jgi:hypothetical protein